MVRKKKKPGVLSRSLKDRNKALEWAKQHRQEIIASDPDEDLPIAIYDHALSLYQLDQLPGRYVLVYAPHSGTVRAYSVFHSAVKNFAKASEDRIFKAMQDWDDSPPF